MKGSTLSENITDGIWHFNWCMLPRSLHALLMKVFYSPVHTSCLLVDILYSIAPVLSDQSLWMNTNYLKSAHIRHTRLDKTGFSGFSHIILVWLSTLSYKIKFFQGADVMRFYIVGTYTNPFLLLTVRHTCVFRFSQQTGKLLEMWFLYSIPRLPYSP